MARKFKLKLRICCATSTNLRYAAPDSKSIKKLRELYVRRTGGGSLNATICHVPVGINHGHHPVCINYASGEWALWVPTV